MADVTIIDLNPIWVECWCCGEETSSRWGLPVYEDTILRNDDEGEWGGVPACERCYLLHQAGNIERLYEIKREADAKWRETRKR